MPTDDSFLTEYFKQSQERMRHTSDVELRLLQFLLLFFPIIGVMMATLYDTSIDRTAYLYLSIGASIFLGLITWFMDNKIRAEHGTYRDIGQAVKQVWRYFKLQEVGAYLENDRIIAEEKVNPDPDKGYGTGKGYKLTLWIVWVIAGVMMTIILTLGILKFTSTPSG